MVITRVVYLQVEIIIEFHLQVNHFNHLKYMLKRVNIMLVSSIGLFMEIVIMNRKISM